MALNVVVDRNYRSKPKQFNPYIQMYAYLYIQSITKF